MTLDIQEIRGVMDGHVNRKISDIRSPVDAVHPFYEDESFLPIIRKQGGTKIESKKGRH